MIDKKIENKTTLFLFVSFWNFELVAHFVQTQLILQVIKKYCNVTDGCLLLHRCGLKVHR